MTSRRQRRAEVAAARKMARSEIMTFLVEANDPRLAQEPTLQAAIKRCLMTAASNRPTCIGCRSTMGNSAPPMAFLLASSATTTSVSAFCARCWRDLSNAELEQHSLRILQRLLPGAHFEEPPRTPHCTLPRRIGPGNAIRTRRCGTSYACTAIGIGQSRLYPPSLSLEGLHCAKAVSACTDQKRYNQ